MELENFIATPAPKPLLKRLIQRFYGYSQPWPFGEKPSPNGICTEVVTVFGWKDRLRVLLGGVVWVKVVIDCENEPGGTSSRAVTFIQQPGTMPQCGSARGFN